MNGRPVLPPSPPHSVARSSTAASMYSVAGTNGGGARKYSTQSTHMYEEQLQEHHRILKDFLAQSLREDRAYQPHNRARDKLLRLSQIQFQELSTDVYDELLRREDERAVAQDPQAVPTRVPKFLLPKNNFHPKRNQARQKLSTLASKKFRELATDVLFELERRYPQFTGAENIRGSSPVSSGRGGGMTIGVPSYNGTGRRPSGASPPYSPAVFDESDRASLGPRPSGEHGRPLPKTFHADTMIPNKSTMVEDDDDQSADEDEDAFNLEGRTTARSSRRATNMSTAMRTRDSNLVAENQAQISRLEQKVTDLEEQIREREQQLQSKDNDLKQALNRAEENQLRLMAAEETNGTLAAEIETMKTENAQMQRDLKNVADAEEWKTRCQELEKEVDERQKFADEVRRETVQSLQEMRVLAERSTQAIEQEDNLIQQVSDLETAVDDWKSRYAKAKTQLRTLRSNSSGLHAENLNSTQYASSHGLIDPQGLIRDVSVTKFQMAIDELLRVARSEECTKVVDHTRSIVIAVRAVSEDLGKTATKDPPEIVKKRSKLKSRVVTACNNLISTSRGFANGKGLSPVSLVDAAASNLTFAVIDLIKLAKIRPTPAAELDDGNNAVA